MRRLFSSAPVRHPVHIAVQEVTKRDGFVIVQIGAYLGDSENDPLFQLLRTRMKERRGVLILVEPVKEFFDRLVENYRGIPGVRFENVAISDRSGPATFYRLGVDPVAHGFPEWLSQLGSLKNERMGALWDKYEANAEYKAFYLAHRIEDKVDCITFSELLSRHRTTKVDLLQMDTEGFEFEIIRTIDFESTPIRFVNYEFVLLHEQKIHTEKILQARGYRLVDFGQDTFCYQAQDGHLARRWSRGLIPLRSFAGGAT